MHRLLTLYWNNKYIYSGASLLIVTFLLINIFGSTVLASFGLWGDSSLIHGCKDSQNRIRIVGPSDVCQQNETQVTWLKDVDAGAGLSINRTSSGATISLNGSNFKAYQVDPTDLQTTTSTSFVDMTSGTQQVTLSQKSILQVDAHTNAFLTPPTSFSLNDKTANSNNLTNNNGASEVNTGLPFADSERGVDFENSSSQYLSISDASQVGLDITGDMTIEAWIKIESFNGGFNSLVAKDASAGRGYNFIYASNQLGIIINGTAATVSPTLDAGNWYHIAVVYTASTGSATFYVNGSQAGSAQTGLPTSIPNNAQEFRVGASGFGDYIDGQVDDLRVWNLVRTQSQINDNKNLELSGNETGLVAYYPFEEPVDGSYLGYIRTTYDSGGADTEIGKQGYTNTTSDGQSIAAGGVVILDPGTYTIAIQKKVGSTGGTATFNQPGMSIVITPTQ